MLNFLAPLIEVITILPSTFPFYLHLPMVAKLGKEIPFITLPGMPKELQTPTTLLILLTEAQLGPIL